MSQRMQEFKEELAVFHEMTKKFYANEISRKEYKAVSGGFGSYAQRDGKLNMLRLRLPGGRLTKEKLKFVADAIAKYKVKRVHFTTCQTIQFHDLSAEEVCGIMEEAFEAGIITRGGGGDFPRNVMASPLSGVSAWGYFDVMPYAEAVSDYLLSIIQEVRLPRKLKVGFSDSPVNETHVTFRDLGFAARADGTFDVYSAGGLGRNPLFGVRVGEQVPPSKVLYYVKAMIETFLMYGNYEDRSRARTRYMQETLGADGYRRAYLERLKEEEKEECDLTVQENPVTKRGKENGISDRRIIAQKQAGLYAVSYHPVGGMPEVSKFAELYAVTEPMQDTEVRIGPDQTIYIINLNSEEARQVLSVTSDGAQTLFESSVACIGSGTCQIGIQDSQGTMAEILAEVRKYHFADGVLPRIYISGCTSSCGTHQVGIMSFHGGVKRIDGKTEPVFTLHVNGSDREGEERFAKPWGMIRRKDIPSFLTETGQAVAEEKTTFRQWFASEPEKLRKIAEKYLI